MNNLFSHDETREWIGSLERRASSAAVMCEATDGRLLIVKANYKTHWSLPGGVIDPGETPLQAAIRETQEEVGIEFDPSELTFVMVADRISDVAQTYQFIFKASVNEAILAKIQLQASEIDEFLLVSKEQVNSGDRHYGKAIRAWATGETGYVEQRLRVPSN